MIRLEEGLGFGQLKGFQGPSPERLSYMRHIRSIVLRVSGLKVVVGMLGRESPSSGPLSLAPVSAKSSENMRFRHVFLSSLLKQVLRKGVQNWEVL